MGVFCFAPDKIEKLWNKRTALAVGAVLTQKE